LVSFVDNSAFNAPINGSFTTLVTAPTNTAFRGVAFSPVNATPQILSPAGQTLYEDTSLLFQPSNGNQIFITDADADPNLVSVKLSVTNPLPGTGSPGLHGNLTLGSTSNLASFSGNGTAAVTITGHLSDINHALVGLKYQPALNYNDDYGNSPADTFTIF